jgi:antirestriction protein ArdC
MQSQTSGPSRPDTYGSITARIIAAIEQGADEFVMPWHRGGPGLGRPTNAATGAQYRGGNIVALWAEGTLSGFRSGHWATYRQWGELGAQVRRGEKAAPILFFKTFGRRTDAEEDGEQRQRRVARASYVFNADQVDGWSSPELPTVDLVERLNRVDRFILSVGARIRQGGDIACYWLRDDLIQMPDRCRFVGTGTSTPTEAYYATLLHEHIHWTGAGHRLNRPFGNSMRDPAYAREELVAELGAAFLCADLAIANEPRADHAAYLAHWLSVLETDPRALFTAARLATEAIDFLQVLSR